MNQLFLINFATTAKARREIVDGVEYAVAPVVATKSLVMNGIYCPPALFQANASKFEGVPVPVGHAFDASGKPVPIASQPEKIIGDWRNVHFEDGKLKGEVWVNVALANSKGFGWVVTQLDAGVPMEVSTAYGGALVAGQGEIDGKKYSSVLTDIQNADHLALLPNEKGACSGTDGCGVFANSEREHQGMLGKLMTFMRSAFFQNELSHDDIRRAIREALKLENGAAYYYIADVFDDTFVYQVEIQGGPIPSSYLQRGYSKTDKGISLGSDVVPVTIRTVYEPIANQEGSEMNRKDKVDALIANKKASEKDREHLMGLSDELFANVEKACGCPGAQAPATVVNSAAPSLTAEQVAEIVNGAIDKKFAANAAEAEATEKADVIAKVLKVNKAFTEDELKALPLATVKKLLNSAQPATPWYGGRGTAVVNSDTAEGWDAPEIIANRQEGK